MKIERIKVIEEGEEGQMGPDGKPLPGKNSRINVEGGGDCLRVNIWSPALGKAKLPVLVYIPGGGSMSCDNSEIDVTVKMLTDGSLMIVNRIFRTAGE